MKYYGRDQEDWEQNETTTVKMDKESLMKRGTIGNEESQLFGD